MNENNYQLLEVFTINVLKTVGCCANVSDFAPCYAKSEAFAQELVSGKCEETKNLLYKTVFRKNNL